MRPIRNTACIGVLLLSAGCASAAEPQVAADCSTLTKTFFRKPLRTQIAEFSGFDLATQYDVYICGNQRLHPPAMHLSDPLAARGEGAVGFLKDKLAQANDDLTIRDLILVFTEMSRQETYDVAMDSDLLALMDTSVHRMKDEGWRATAEGMIREIK